MEHICQECKKPMQNYSKPSRPYWVCEECNGDENGLEVEWCESCGYPFPAGDECDCGGDEYDDYEEDDEELPPWNNDW